MELEEGQLRGLGKQQSAATTTGIFIYARQSVTCMSIYGDNREVKLDCLICPQTLLDCAAV